MMSLYLLYDDGSKVEEHIGFLTNERKKRYDEATRLKSKRQLLISTLLHVYILNNKGLVKKTVKTNKISEDQHNDLTTSNAHSERLFAELVEDREVPKKIAVDVEHLVDRPQDFYHYFFRKNGIARHTNLSLKDDFYRQWLAYELSIKARSHPLLIKKIAYIQKNDYLIGIYPNKKVKIFDINLRDIVSQLDTLCH